MIRFSFGSHVRGITVPVVLALFASVDARAAIVATLSAGSGESLSTIQIDFSNGNGYVIEYRYDGAATGFSALEALVGLLPEFTLVYDDTIFGPLVTGMGVFRDYEYGTGDLWPKVENYWHYWVMDTGDWSFSFVGASGRTLFDGSFDGWVFGLPAAPQPIPAPSVMVLLAVAAMQRRRRDRGRGSA